MRKLAMGWMCLIAAVVFCAGSAQAAGSLSGFVTKNSAALPNAYVDVIDSGSNFQEVQTGPGGAYTMSGLAPGNADVYCYAPDGVKFIEHPVVNVPDRGAAITDYNWSFCAEWVLAKKNGAIVPNVHPVLNDKNPTRYDHVRPSA